jgi:lysophospholipase L1-like esterase
MLFTGAMLMSASIQAVLPDGDITEDNTIDIADYLHGLQYLLGNRTLSTDAINKGDVAPLLNGVPDPDGMLGTGDVMVLLRMILYGINFSYPSNQFNIGDSIGEGQAANGGGMFHEHVWSTGYLENDSVNSFNERFEQADSLAYEENNAERDTIYNLAQSGAVMADFVDQAQNVVANASALPSGEAGMVTVLLGNNDVCAPSNSEMTDPSLFEDQFRAGLDVLAGDEATRLAQIHISGIPAIYWLWVAKRNNWICRVIIWPFVPCQNLLDEPQNDCVSSDSRNDPDNDYPNENVDCQRRKNFHRLIREDYNTLLQDVAKEYRDNGLLPNIRYVDIFDVQFGTEHVNDDDCFHPSVAGHELLADEAWCRTHWRTSDGQCPN